MTTTIDTSQLSTLVIAAGMVALGILGLTGTITGGPVVVAVLFLVAAVLAYRLGTARGRKDSRGAA